MGRGNSALFLISEITNKWVYRFKTDKVIIMLLGENKMSGIRIKDLVCIKNEEDIKVILDNRGFSFSFAAAQILAENKALTMEDCLKDLTMTIREYQNDKLSISDCIKVITFIEEYFCYKDEDMRYFLDVMKIFKLYAIYEHHISVTEKQIPNQLYVIEFDNKSIKIGITNNFLKRLISIQSASGLTAIKYKVFYDIENVRDKEQKIHKKYKDFRLKGEYFSINFDEAVDYIKNFLKAG